MNALNKLGGALLALILVIVVLAGAATAQGRAVLVPLWQATQAVFGWARTSIPTTPAAGEVWPALGVGALVVLALIIFFEWFRFGRGLAVGFVIGGLVALLVYNPTAFA